MIGQTISHYKILEKLGEGGMGVVYKAHDTKLDRDVALKFLPHHLTVHEEEKARFFQEARAIATMNHPHVCTIYRIDEFEGQPFIEMEYLDGVTLRRKIPIQKVEDGISYALQIGAALEEAHSRGIVHRDIKCDNIMVNSKNQIKVMDFGLAKLRGSLKLTHASSTVGTIAYMAPEQMQGGEVDARADIFSFGVVLFELISGRLPFRGEHETAMMYSILNEEPLSLAALRPETPLHTQRVIGKALEKSREMRYPSMTALLAELRGTVAVSPVRDNRPLSLAVLPFENMSPEKENEYFSDGLTEEIITTLSKLRQLRVVSRTSAMHYKGTTLSLPDIARELGVHFILEGSVRKQGKTVRINAQLIDAVKDHNLWAEQFNGTLNDLFEIQESVAGQITAALKVQLSHDEHRDLRKRWTDDTEAYQSYLKGRYYWNKRTKEGIAKAIQSFQAAIEKDPTYAIAYSGLADCFSLLAFFGHADSRKIFPQAKLAAQRALEIDNSIAEAHASLGYSGFLFDWNWLYAEDEFTQAINLNPQYSIAHHWYAIYLLAMGRLEDAQREIRQAQELDPLSMIIHAAAGWILYWCRQPDAAIKECRKALDIDEHFWSAHMVIGSSLCQKKQCEQGIEELEVAVRNSNNPWAIEQLGYAYAISGNTGKALAQIDLLDKVSVEGNACALSRAIIYAGLNRVPETLEWLEKAIEEKSSRVVYLGVDPVFDALRDDQRFTKLLQQIGLQKKRGLN